MKICLLGDTHFGVRNDSKVFHEYYEKFYDEIFFPYLKHNGIDTVIQLGDLFDRRKYINFLSLTESRRYFFDKLRDAGIHLHALIGNHDIFYKHTLDVNSPELLLKGYDNITLWNKEGTLELDGLSIDMIPWMCNDNEKEILDFINGSVSPICLGHFELLGFEMSKGVESHEGINSTFLSRYDHVYSGHYHTKSTSKNVSYLGTPYELFWSDYKDTKGFYVLDTKDSSVEFVENPLRMFYKINYNDVDNQELNLDYSEYANTYVKVVVINKQNPFKFDTMMDELYKTLPTDITIVEDFTEASLNGDDDEIDQAEDTVTILSNFIDQQNLTNVDGAKLKTLMRELYVEALSSETIE
jgi:DNA repair exonuclease SbcCD nuclease subunit